MERSRVSGRPCRFVFRGDQGVAHQKAIEEEAGSVEGDLRKLEHDADLHDEAEAF